MNEFAYHSSSQSAFESAALGGYFVSEEQKDAVIGRVVREKVGVEKEVALLRIEARRLGQVLYLIGKDLTERPEHVGFSGVGGNIKYAQSSATLFEARDIDGNQIVKLVTDLRTALDKLERLNQEAKSLGIS
jgi:hypothetical protein